MAGRPQLGEMGAQCFPRFRVAKELLDVDGEGVEQLLILARVVIEQPGVIGVGVDAARAHANRDAALQAFFLVGFAADAALAGDLLRERLEAALVPRPPPPPPPPPPTPPPRPPPPPPPRRSTLSCARPRAHRAPSSRP